MDSWQIAVNMDILFWSQHKQKTVLIIGGINHLKVLRSNSLVYSHGSVQSVVDTLTVPQHRVEMVLYLYELTTAVLDERKYLLTTSDTILSTSLI